MEAKDESERGRNVLKEEARRLCAAKDSRPLLKANDPMGRAESERRKRKCVDEEADN